MPTNLASHFLLDDGVIFLNHGSFGACPKKVFRDFQNWQLLLERQPVDFLNPTRKLIARIAEVRRMLGAAFGTNAENLVGVVNATTGLNIVAQSIDLSPGDEILVSNHEYAALYKTWNMWRRAPARTLLRGIFLCRLPANTSLPTT